MPRSALQDPAANGQSRELLDSWKEIAAFMNRGVCTVQRWEREEGLPVHRHNHHKRSTVFAYTTDIQNWISSRSRAEVARDQVAPATLYGNLDSGDLVAKCIAARHRAEYARRLVEVIYGQRQAQIGRALARLQMVMSARALR